MTMTKIDHIRGVNARLAELQATTANLSLSEKQSLLASLERDVKAAAAKEDGPKRRLENIKAAAVSKDLRTAEAFKRVTASLQRLGYNLESIAASGSLPADLDEKMRSHRWTDTQKIALKLNLGIVGAL
jgi:hypothetical protein